MYTLNQTYKQTTQEVASSEDWQELLSQLLNDWNDIGDQSSFVIYNNGSLFASISNFGGKQSENSEVYSLVAATFCEQKKIVIFCVNDGKDDKGEDFTRVIPISQWQMM